MGSEGQPGGKTTAETEAVAWGQRSHLPLPPAPRPRPPCKAGSPCGPRGRAACQPSHPAATNRKACLSAQISEM